ncbi:31 kDa ribonucleoprotein, chloroplastic [Dendrobium catenatum]|uniref:31 kDa ribonucleoprotein, chloroplastic n=1 Tax=Dendrobium catenatum TaxID=906689 RepID=A0A2I0W7W8_9ASPA|nr:31 kDa ribonucleoprotein, chloroplastic [Dendrobium catenatum]
MLHIGSFLLCTTLPIQPLTTWPDNPGGFFLKIQPYKASRNQKTDFAPEIIDGYNRIYVGNLSWDISEDDLKQLFSDCKISSIRFGTDKETGDFKGYAHVDFADSVSLTIALKFDQKVVCGRPVKVRCAMPRKSGQTESGSRSYDKQQESNQVGDGSSAGKSKKKRRTCYECGTPAEACMKMNIRLSESALELLAWIKV